MKLNQVTVATQDVELSIGFYRRLGLQLIVRTSHYARFVCPDGEATLSVHLVDGPIQTSTLIYFECDDLDARCAELRATGVILDSDPADQRWLWREARLRDHDGNPICLFHAGENRLNPP